MCLMVSWDCRITLTRVVFTRSNQQNDENRKQRDAGEHTKDHVQGDVPIPQRAEGPVAEAATADANEIHDAVTGRTPFRSCDLAEDRHVVTVEKSPAEAEDDQPHDCDAERARVAHA